MKRFLQIVVLIFIIHLIYLITSDLIGKKVTIEAGPKGGFFDTTALLLQQRLKEKNIDLKIVNREDTGKIIEDVNDNRSKIDLGFVAQDLKNVKYNNVEAVGSLILEPLFIFHRKGLQPKTLADFKGLKIGVGPVNSGTRLLAEQVLEFYGIHNKNSTFVDYSHREHIEMLEKTNLDVAFFLLPANNQLVNKLGNNPSLQIFSLEESLVISRQFNFLYHATISAGGFDIKNRIPANDVKAVALPVNLIANKKLDRSIIVAISLILQEEFKNPNLVSDSGTFPTMKYIFDLPINAKADEIFKLPYGSIPFLYKYFPFSIASLFDNFAVYFSYLFIIISLIFTIGFPKPYNIYKLFAEDKKFKILKELYEKSKRQKLNSVEIAQLNKIIKYFPLDFYPLLELKKKRQIADMDELSKFIKKSRKKN